MPCDMLLSNQKRRLSWEVKQSGFIPNIRQIYIVSPSDQRELMLNQEWVFYVMARTVCMWIHVHLLLT